MKTSNKGIELIKKHEGCVLTAYKCPAGVLTIGYGHTGKDVTPGKKITQSEAETLLRGDLATAENEVTKQLPNLSQNQFDALVSFVFNLGVGNFRSSTLLKKAKVNTNDTIIRGEFTKWNKARVNGVLSPLPGLTKRRAAEADLYFA